jgi:hypothetical protein
MPNQGGSDAWEGAPSATAVSVTVKRRLRFLAYVKAHSTESGTSMFGGKTGRPRRG